MSLIPLILQKKKLLGSKLNQKKLTGYLTSTGNGTGIAMLMLEVSEVTTITLSGSGKFYSDAAATIGETDTWVIAATALRTVYIKVTSGISIMNIDNRFNILKIGNTTTFGWVSSTHAPSLSINLSKLTNLTNLRTIGNSIYTGAIPAKTTYLRLDGASVWNYTGALPNSILYLYIASASNWNYSGALPTSLTSVVLSNSTINWTGLDIPGAGNITDFRLMKFRSTKMSSADMLVLLTNLTNREGGLPSTITINDYADYASPPQSVVDAVAALKLAKTITTVNLGA